MKKELFITCFLMLFSLSTFAQNDGVLGMWKTIDDETGDARSYVEVFERDGKVFGKIIEVIKADVPDPRCELCDPEDDRYNQPVKGMELIRDMKKSGNAYTGGTILDPENGKVYKCKIWIEEGNLKMRGYVGFFYRTQTWLPK